MKEPDPDLLEVSLSKPPSVCRLCFVCLLSITPLDRREQIQTDSHSPQGQNNIPAWVELLLFVQPDLSARHILNDLHYLCQAMTVSCDSLTQVVLILDFELKRGFKMVLDAEEVVTDVHTTTVATLLH